MSFLAPIRAQFAAMREELDRAEQRLALLNVNDTDARAEANQRIIEVSLDPLITTMTTLAGAYSELGASGAQVDAACLDMAEAAFREHLDDARHAGWTASAEYALEAMERAA